MTYLLAGEKVYICISILECPSLESEGNLFYKSFIGLSFSNNDFLKFKFALSSVSPIKADGISGDGNTLTLLLIIISLIS